MIRILEAFGEPISTGGQESYVFNTVGAMDRSRMSFDLFTPYYKDSPVADSLAKEWGGSVYSLGLEFRPGRSRENLSRAFSSFLESHRYDIVHIHSGSTSALAILARAAKRSGAKVIVHAHAAVERMDFRKRAIRELNGLRMEGSVDVYCACSRSVAESRFRRTIWNRVRIMRNGIETSKLAFNESNRISARSEGGVAGDGIVIGNVGRLSEVKNQGFLIKVFSEFKKKSLIRSCGSSAKVPRGSCLNRRSSGWGSPMMWSCGAGGGMSHACYLEWMCLSSPPSVRVSRMRPSRLRPRDARWSSLTMSPPKLLSVPDTWSRLALRLLYLIGCQLSVRLHRRAENGPVQSRLQMQDTSWLTPQRISGIYTFYWLDKLIDIPLVLKAFSV